MFGQTEILDNAVGNVAYAANDKRTFDATEHKARQFVQPV